jgi:hypothetical protein
MDLYDNNGAPPYGPPGPGGPGSPDSEATSFLDPFTSRYAAVASLAAPEVPPGFWVTYPSEVGPFPGPAAPTIVQLGAAATTQQLDAAAQPSTGNPVARLLGQPTGPYTPLTLAPGQTGTITVTITPDAAAGTVIQGFLYVDAVNANSSTFGSITGSGDELVAIPYAYTAGATSDTTTAIRTASMSTALVARLPVATLDQYRLVRRPPP